MPPRVPRQRSFSSRLSCSASLHSPLGSGERHKRAGRQQHRGSRFGYGGYRRRRRRTDDRRAGPGAIEDEHPASADGQAGPVGECFAKEHCGNPTSCTASRARGVPWRKTGLVKIFVLQQFHAANRSRHTTTAVGSLSLVGNHRRRLGPCPRFRQVHAPADDQRLPVTCRTPWFTRIITASSRAA